MPDDMKAAAVTALHLASTRARVEEYPPGRRACQGEMSYNTEERILDELRNRLGEWSRQNKWRLAGAAVTTLGLLRDVESRDMIRDLARSSTTSVVPPRIQAAALAALASRDISSETDLIFSVYRSGEPRARGAARDLLADVDAERLQELIAECIETGGPEEWKHCTRAISLLPTIISGDEGLGVRMQALATSDELRRDAAVGVLQRLANKPGGSELYLRELGLRRDFPGGEHGISDLRFQELRSSGKTFVVEYWSSEHPTASTLRSVLELRSKISGGVPVYRYEVTADSKLDVDEGVRVMSTVVLYGDGRELQRWEGDEAIPPERVVAAINARVSDLEPGGEPESLVPERGTSLDLLDDEVFKRLMGEEKTFVVEFWNDEHPLASSMEGLARKRLAGFGAVPFYRYPVTATSELDVNESVNLQSTVVLYGDGRELDRWEGDETQPGREMPDRILAALEGARAEAPSIALESLRSRRSVEVPLSDGVIRVLDFHASWCVPCQRISPMVENLAKRYASRGVRVLGINSGESREDAQGFVEELNLTVPVLLDGSNEVSRAYGVTALPTLVVVDGAGRIAGRFLGIAGGSVGELERRLTSLLNRMVEEAE
ncbi:MAG: redoxin domain-containing protein [Myxococcota bacterium]